MSSLADPRSQAPPPAPKKLVHKRFGKIQAQGPPLTAHPQRPAAVREGTPSPAPKSRKKAVAFGSLPPIEESPTSCISFGLPKLRRGHSKTASSPRPPPRQKAAVTLINGNSTVTTRYESEVKPVQLRPTPPSVYLAAESSRQAADRLNVCKSIQTMKRLEQDLAALDEQMAPVDMVVQAQIEEVVDLEEDYFSISSQPDCRKRSRSLSADTEVPNKRSKQETVEIDKEQYAPDCPYDQEYCTTVHVPTGSMVLNQWRDIFEIEEELRYFESQEHLGKVLRFYPDGNHDEVSDVALATSEGFIIPKDYIVVHGKHGMEMHFGDRPRYPAKKGYHWLRKPDGSWEQSWTIWEGHADESTASREQTHSEESIGGAC
ncbi:hypothetical protein EST38_g11656 [Candolleomyces aberdarensis]|uniref:Uncharacterized protein n=1 Tax=Candolleomyces aberdarensis TaxID=2316362 RepID=A0A4Q2D506_9AGAR|nr:hypothetical protein EST38_g11656 [Candolleomyces aberdarensis]